ncbi:MAG: hypothetical protein WBD22_06475 [Pyrinomonadaceae bacterium]
MRYLLPTSFLFVCVLVVCCAETPAQSIVDRSIFSGSPKEEVPKTVEEMLYKRGVEHSKKEHAKMLERGEEALRISEQLVSAADRNGSLTAADLERLDGLEELVKKIRGKLGGDDGGSDEDIEVEPIDGSGDEISGLKKLQSATLKLVGELKNSTRFSISVLAIQSSNSVLQLARILRFKK